MSINREILQPQRFQVEPLIGIELDLSLTMDASGSGIACVLLRRFSPFRYSRTTYAPCLTARASCTTCLSRFLTLEPLRQSASMAGRQQPDTGRSSNRKRAPLSRDPFSVGAFNRNRTDDLILTMDLPKLT